MEKIICPICNSENISTGRLWYSYGEGCEDYIAQVSCPNCKRKVAGWDIEVCKDVFLNGQNGCECFHCGILKFEYGEIDNVDTLVIEKISETAKK